MKYCGIIDYDNGMDCLADVIALIGQEDNEIEDIGKEGGEGFIDSSTDVIADVFNSFYEAYPNGIFITTSEFTTLPLAEEKLIIRIFTKYE